MNSLALTEYLWVAMCVFLLGMSKGGFPVGSLALPLLILLWPGQVEPAKQVVAFMLPLLCVMDCFAVAFYWRHIQWKRILPLVPGSLAGVALGSLFFLSENAAAVAVSDRSLKVLIGVIGILFVGYRLSRKWIVRRLTERSEPHRVAGMAFGGAAGFTSTLAHAAGPLAQMYFLMQGLPKMEFAATLAGFFFGLNLVKLIPFALLGRLEVSTLILGLKVLPLVPIGVASGYGLVRITRSSWYIAFIYIVLFFTSSLLIWKAIAGD
jgi:uncharacterized membrane protein YfcA